MFFCRRLVIVAVLALPVASQAGIRDFCANLFTGWPFGAKEKIEKPVATSAPIKVAPAAKVAIAPWAAEPAIDTPPTRTKIVKIAKLTAAEKKIYESKGKIKPTIKPVDAKTPVEDVLTSFSYWWVPGNVYYPTMAHYNKAYLDEIHSTSALEDAHLKIRDNDLKPLSTSDVETRAEIVYPGEAASFPQWDPPAPHTMTIELMATGATPNSSPMGTTQDSRPEPPMNPRSQPQFPEGGAPGHAEQNPRDSGRREEQDPTMDPRANAVQDSRSVYPDDATAAAAAAAPDAINQGQMIQEIPPPSQAQAPSATIDAAPAAAPSTESAPVSEPASSSFSDSSPPADSSPSPTD